MSTDEETTELLIQQLNDNKHAYEQGIEQLRRNSSTDIAGTLAHVVAQRERFAHELQDFAAAYGDEIENAGTPEGDAVIEFEKLRAALEDQDQRTTLKRCLDRDQQLIGAYVDGLARDLSEPLAKLVGFQLGKVRELHTAMSTLAS